MSDTVVPGRCQGCGEFVAWDVSFETLFPGVDCPPEWASRFPPGWLEFGGDDFYPAYALCPGCALELEGDGDDAA